MILGYDRRPDASVDDKVKSLMESVQMALNETVGAKTDSNVKGIDEKNGWVGVNHKAVSGQKVTLPDQTVVDGEMVFIQPSLDASVQSLPENDIKQVLAVRPAVDGDKTSYIESTKGSDGNQRMTLATRRLVNDTYIYSGLRFGIDNDGTRTLTLWTPSLWRKTIEDFPVGACYTTATNTNPASLLGYGTWSLIDKSFAYAWETNPFVFNTANTQSGASVVIRHGTMIECRLTWQNKVAISGTDRVIATIDFDNYGLTEQQHTQFPVGYSDGLNAVGLFTTSWSGTTMTITASNWVTRPTSYPTGTGQSTNLSFVFVVQGHGGMEDAKCNQFIWRRTA